MKFGSTLFFKRLIVFFIIFLFLFLGVFCVILISENRQMEEDIYALNKSVEELSRADAKGTGLLNAEAPDYQSLYPELIRPSSNTSAETVSSAAYLTFDDGPSYITDKILDTLAEKNVKATFFVIGSQLYSEENQARLRRIADEGHTIGIHTYSHKYNDIYSSVESYLTDFYTVWNQVKEITGIECEIFRFPGGSVNSYNQNIYQELSSEMLRRGFVYYDWNVSAQDALPNGISSVESIIANAVMTKNMDRVIILMHDNGEKDHIAQALPYIIDSLSQQGYSMEPLSVDIAPITFGYPS